MVQVKQIQEEYQAYMEGVRATAQGAIDQANALFQALRQDATHTLDNAIHYLQSRFFAMQVLVRGLHRRRTAHLASGTRPRPLSGFRLTQFQHGADTRQLRRLECIMSYRLDSLPAPCWTPVAELWQVYPFLDDDGDLVFAGEVVLFGF